MLHIWDINQDLSIYIQLEKAIMQDLLRAVIMTGVNNGL